MVTRPAPQGAGLFYIDRLSPPGPLPHGPKAPEPFIGDTTAATNTGVSQWDVAWRVKPGHAEWHSPPTFHVEHCPDRKGRRRQCFTWNIPEYRQGQALVFHVKPAPLDVPPSTPPGACIPEPALSLTPAALLGAPTLPLYSAPRLRRFTQRPASAALLSAPPLPLYSAPRLHHLALSPASAALLCAPTPPLYSAPRLRRFTQRYVPPDADP